jgi:hypothetical protein
VTRSNRHVSTETDSRIIAAVWISSGQGQVVQRSVLLSQHEWKAVSERYARERAEKYQGSWKASQADLDGLEANLPLISKLEILGWGSKIHIDRPEQYYRQYVAVLVSGKRMIFVNAFRDAQDFSDWHDRLLIVVDGDIGYWQVLYNPATKQFFNLRINARA